MKKYPSNSMFFRSNNNIHDGRQKRIAPELYFVVLEILRPEILRLPLLYDAKLQVNVSNQLGTKVCLLWFLHVLLLIFNLGFQLINYTTDLHCIFLFCKHTIFLVPMSHGRIYSLDRVITGLNLLIIHQKF
jgi:hypothetical protein